MRPIHAFPVLLVIVALAGCGGGSGGSSSSDSAAPATTQQLGPRDADVEHDHVGQAAAGPDGAKVFASAGCVGCHTLKAAGATGNVGPNLDDLKPSFEAVKTQVTNGGGGMPAFGGNLSAAEIVAVARYVSANAGQ